MKTIIIISIYIALLVSVSAQTLTKTKQKTVNENGDTLLTESIIISEAMDITTQKDMVIVNPLKFFVFSI